MRQHTCDCIARVTFDQAASIAALDAEVCSADTKAYISQNTMAYYVLINTWYMLLSDHDKSAAERIILTAFRTGLFPLIETASEMSDNIISTLGGKPCERNYNILNDLFDPIIAGLDYDTSNLRKKEADVISVLRYPKRFTPIGADRLAATSVSNFIDYNNKVKLASRKPMISHDIVCLRRIMTEDILPGADAIVDAVMSGCDAEVMITDEFGNTARHFFQSCDYVGTIPTGSSTADVGREPAPKIISIYRTVGGFYTNRVPIWDSRLFLQKMEDYRSYLKLGGKKEPAHAIPVPKNYKKNRIIAKESPYASWCMGAFVSLLYDIFKRLSPYADCIDLEDQGRARRLCLESSMTQDLLDICTIDLSNASDTISLCLLLSVLPYSVGQWVSALRSDEFIASGKKYLTHMACTSGQRQTFILECFFFLAVAILGHDRACMFMLLPKRCKRTLGKKKIEYTRNVHRINIYGDDMEVPRFAFDSVISLLESLDQVPNRDKSFEFNYLESCGVESYWGIDLTTRYFPRKSLTATRDGLRLTTQSLDAVIDLQHRLFGTTAAIFLTELVMSQYPTMTSSAPGNVEYGDLWSLSPTVLGEDGELYPERAALDPEMCMKMRNKMGCTGFYKVGLVSGGSPSKYLPWAPYKHTELTQSGARYVCETFAYVRYLRSGPVYGSPIDELLKVSEHHSLMSDLFGTIQKYTTTRF